MPSDGPDSKQQRVLRQAALTQDSDPDAGYVRLQVTDFERLRQADAEALALKREIAELRVQIDNLSLMGSPDPRETHPTMRDDADAALDTIHAAASDVQQALTTAGLLPGPDLDANITSQQYNLHNKAPASNARYGVIWLAILQQHEQRMELMRAELREQGRSPQEIAARTNPHQRGRAGLALLKPTTVEVICQAIEAGMSRKGALAMGGLPSKVFEAYKAKAKLSIEPYASLFDLIEIAEARIENKLVRRWEAETTGNWTAASAFLARRFTNEWSDKRIIEHTIQELSDMPIEKLAAMVGPEASQWLEHNRARDNILDIPALKEEDFIGPEFDPNKPVEPHGPLT